jgi:hypothetical protein
MLSYEPVVDQEVYKKQLKMYVLVNRNILPLVHCGVQAAHAIAEFVEYHQNENTRKWVREDKTLIVLEATEEQILKQMNLFAGQNMNYQPFREPDMSNALTAVAFQPISNELGSTLFKGFRLLR